MPSLSDITLKFIISLFVTADIQIVEVCIMCGELIHIKFCVSSWIIY